MEGDSPPLWPQSTAAFLPHRRRSSAPILNPVFLILLIPTLFLLLIFFLLPPLLSHTSEFLRAGSVKKSWDSFNVLLVVCAILCGVFARRNDAGSATTTNIEEEEPVLISNAGKSHPSASDQWFVQDRPSPVIRTPATGTGRLTRNSSSYPDLRNESLWETDESRFRFFDDFELNHYRAPTAAPVTSRHLPARRTSGSEDRDDFLVKEIPVDSFVVRSTSTAPPRPPSPPKSPENQVQRRTFQSVPIEEEIKVEQDQFQFKIQTTIPESDQSPLFTEEAIANRMQERKLKRSDRKKSGSAKEIATAIASSFYNQRKRKRKIRTRNIYDNANESASVSSSPLFQQAAQEQPPPPPMAAPPPPPPPPPPSFFQNIFKKGSKTKRVHSVSVSVSTPPPPPPPPPRSLFNNLLKTGGKSKRFQSASGPPPPPPPPPSSIFNNIFKSNTKSKRFHSISTPPPPPLPPPPPPSSTFRNMFRTGTKSKRFDPISKYPPSFEESTYSNPQSPRLHTPPPSTDSPRQRNSSAGRPPLPTKMNQYYDGNESTINSGAQSPLIRIPSPPPLPPFKIPEMKFFARGDFVRIRSTHSSRCSSPGLDDIDFPPSRSSDATDGGGGSITNTCPSPDVNLKADSFIARLRGEWKIELMNSVNERRKMGQQP